MLHALLQRMGSKEIACVAMLLIMTTPLLQAKRELRVAIYSWIPDLADDKLQTLKEWIEATFEAENSEIDLKILTAIGFDIYDIDDLKSHLINDPSAPHVVEIDTILLGEIVDEDLIAEIDPQTYGLKVPGAYLPFTLEAVQYNGSYYAVPTFICANYLMGVNVGDASQICPIQNGATAYSDLNNVLNQCKQNLIFPPRTMTLTGNFKGSWQLPNVYIDTYIDHHGRNTVYEAINSNIPAQTDVISDMKSFIEYCQTEDGNKCFSGAFKSVVSMLTAVVDKRQTITSYSYSEYIGTYLQHTLNNGIHFDVYDIIAPPLGPNNNFLMYTDALVINKALQTTTTLQDIDDFINFYSRLNTRLSIAFGDDLPAPHPPRYLMQARNDFYTTQNVTNDSIYSLLNGTLQYAVAAPNHGLYYNRHEMAQQITQTLNIMVESLISFDQCEMVPHIHPRYRNVSLEDYVDDLQEFNGTFSTKYWEVLPQAKSDPMCIPNDANGCSVSAVSYNIFIFAIIVLCIFTSTC